jgi:hypothetical protein
MKNRLTLLALSLTLAACSSTPSPFTGAPAHAVSAARGVLRFSHHPARSHDTPGGLHWLSSQGLGEAIADCGDQWVAIAGGAYSPSATDIGTGFPGNTGSTWIAYSATYNAPLTAYVLCAPAYNLNSYFYRLFAKVASRAKSAVASCNSGDLFVAGWGYGVKWEGPALKNGVAVGWIAGGSPTATSVVECATNREWTGTGMELLTKSAGSGKLYVSCDGDDDDVIGGSYGSVTTTGSGSPGPPQRQYPGVTSGSGSTAPTGFWFVNSKSSTKGVVACQHDA